MPVGGNEVPLFDRRPSERAVLDTDVDVGTLDTSQNVADSILVLCQGPTCPVVGQWLPMLAFRVQAQIGDAGTPLRGILYIVFARVYFDGRRISVPHVVQSPDDI